MSRKIKKIILYFSLGGFIFTSYFVLIHLLVYKNNYSAIITNAEIIIKHPHCISSFLSAENLKSKFSYKLYLWINKEKVDPARNPIARKGKAIFLPDELVRGYFTDREGVNEVYNRLECEFNSEGLTDSSVKYYSYKYMRESVFLGGLGDRKVKIFINHHNKKTMEVVAKLYWEY